MMVSVVLGCVTASKTGILFLLLETENITVCGQSLLLPRVSPGGVLLVQLFTLQLNWENSEQCREAVVSQARD